MIQVYILLLVLLCNCRICKNKDGLGVEVQFRGYELTHVLVSMFSSVCFGKVQKKLHT